MSPRHFSRMMQTKQYNDHLADKIKPGMNLWYAFFSISGLDKTITKLFTYTPEIMQDSTAKHGEARVDQTSLDTQNPL